MSSAATRPRSVRRSCLHVAAFRHDMSHCPSVTANPHTSAEATEHAKEVVEHFEKTGEVDKDFHADTKSDDVSKQEVEMSGKDFGHVVAGHKAAITLIPRLARVLWIVTLTCLRLVIQMSPMRRRSTPSRFSMNSKRKIERHVLSLIIPCIR
jgi:hypothetical protein